MARPLEPREDDDHIGMWVAVHQGMRVGEYVDWEDAVESAADFPGGTLLYWVEGQILDRDKVFEVVKDE